MKQEDVLKQFGYTDSLIRGTGLASNLSYWALVSLLSGFGEHALTFAVSIQLFVHGILEIPSSIFSDKVGQEKSLKLAFILKFFATASVALAVYSAIQNKTNLALFFLVIESIIDAFASALLSGSYEASYVSWLEKKQKEFNLSTKISLFIDSYKYGVWLRIFIPVIVLIIGSLSLIPFENIEIPISIITICYVFSLRLSCLFVTSSQLKKIHLSRKKLGNWSIDKIFSSVKTFNSDSVFLSGAVFSLYLVSFFFFAEIFRILKNSNIGIFGVWSGGTLVCLIINLSTIILNKKLLPLLSEKYQNSNVIFPFFYASITLISMALFWVFESSILQVIVLAIFSIISLVVAQSIHRSILSLVLPKINLGIRATWISLSQSLGCLVAGFFVYFTTNFFNSFAVYIAFSIQFFSTVVFLLFVFFKRSKNSSSSETIDSYLGIRTLVTVLSVMVVVSFFDIMIFSKKIKQIVASRDNADAEMLLNSIKNPIIQGSLLEAKFRIQNFVDKTNAVCVESVVFKEKLSSCNHDIFKLKIKPIIKKLKVNPSYDQSIGEVSIYFSNNDFKSLLNQRIIQLVIMYSALTLILVFVLQLFVKKINSEAKKIINYDKEPTDKKLNFSLIEFQELFDQLDQNLKKIKAGERDKAIAQTTQMFAHDVRKPFTMIQALLGMIDSSEEPKQLAKKFVPEVNRAINSVNGMINDVIEVGSDSKLSTEPTKPESLIDAALSEVFRNDEKSEITLSYKLDHEHKVYADSLKVLRVFTNIIANASQAMKGKGNIWFKTKKNIENEISYVEFCIGNSNSFIPEGDLKNLFEAFFTKNKKGGTGLGLAIAKKIITAHGGQIRCESSKELGVEFYMTLPIVESTQIIADITKLPKSSKEILIPVTTKAEKNPSEASRG